MRWSKDTGLLVAAGVAVSAAVIYGFFDPESFPYFPRCGFKVLTGYDCPGCGSQRALHALLHGEVSAAWEYNAFLVAIIPLIILLLIGEYLRIFRPSILYSSNKLKRMERCFTSRWFVLIIAFVALVWWVGRNVW